MARRESSLLSDPELSQTPPAGGVLLDGFAIVGACAAELPEECFQATLSSRGFADVETDDLHHFGELSMLDVGDNVLRDVALFSPLVNLRDLRMACNAVSVISFPPDAFRRLTSLDLSFNGLDHRCFLPLSTLGRLVTLNLCANNIDVIPVDVFVDGDAANFPSLESLDLSSQSPPLTLERCALAPLGTLSRLAHLSLHGNALTGVVPPGDVLVGLFPSLRSLDLSCNAIELEMALSPLAALASQSTRVDHGRRTGVGGRPPLPPGAGLEEVSVWGNEVAEMMLAEATGAAAAEEEASARRHVPGSIPGGGGFGPGTLFDSTTKASAKGRAAHGGTSATQRAAATSKALAEAVRATARDGAAVFTPVPSARLGGVGTLAVPLRDTEGRVRVMLTRPSGPAPPTLGTFPTAKAEEETLPHRDPCQLRFDCNPAAVEAAFDRLGSMIDERVAAGVLTEAGPGVTTARSTSVAVSSTRSPGATPSLGGYDTEDGRNLATDRGLSERLDAAGWVEEGGMVGEEGAGLDMGHRLDATAKLMLALGMDMGDGTVELPPRRGPSMMGGGGGEGGALKALKYALEHPLLDDAEVAAAGRPKPNHMKMTAAIAGRMKPPIRKEAIRADVAALEEMSGMRRGTKASAAAAKMASIEDVLSGMKSRLREVEENLRATTRKQRAQVLYDP